MSAKRKRILCWVSVQYQQGRNIFQFLGALRTKPLKRTGYGPAEHCAVSGRYDNTNMPIFPGVSEYLVSLLIRMFLYILRAIRKSYDLRKIATPSPTAELSACTHIKFGPCDFPFHISTEWCWASARISAVHGCAGGLRPFDNWRIGLLRSVNNHFAVDFRGESVRLTSSVYGHPCG